jgi:hypothetical protein
MLVQIRERSYLELLDLALVVVRQRPLALGTAAAAGIAPWAAAYAWMASYPDVWSIGLPALVWFVAPWATAPLTIVLGGLMFGERPPARRVAGTIVRKLPSLVLYQGILRGLLTVVGAGFIVIPARLTFLNEVILLERGRGGERPGMSVFRRCGALSRDRASDLFGQWLANLIFATLFVLAFRWGVESLIQALVEELTWDTGPEDPSERLAGLFTWCGDLRAWTAQVGIWLAVAFFGVVHFLTYIDQRIRLEGWEVELRLRAAGAAVEDAE